MNRCLQILAACFVIAQPVCAEPTAGRSGQFVFLVDTSAAMGRKQQATLRSIRTLIGSGFGGKIKDGDTFVVWTFGQSLHSDVFPARRWANKENKLLAEIGAEMILSETHEGRSDTEPVFKEVLNALSKTNGAALIVITDQSLNGTPFDLDLQHYYSSRKMQILRERKAIVTGFVFDAGAPVSFSTGITGESFKMPDYLPPYDDALRAAQSQVQKPAALPPPEIILAEPPKLPPEEPSTTLLARIVRPAITNAPAAEPTVAQKNEEAPVPKPSLPTEPTRSVAKIDAPVVSKPDPIPQTVHASPPPAEPARLAQKQPIEKESVDANIPVPSVHDLPETTVPSERAAGPGPVFGFEAFAYLFGGVMTVILIAWRILTRSTHRETRSLITRSMDIR